MEMISYVPYPLGIDQHWNIPEDLYRHLLHNTDERQRLQRMVDQQAWTGMIGGIVWIHHPCSPPIYLHYQQPDKDLQLQLLCLIYNKSRTQNTIPLTSTSYIARPGLTYETVPKK